MLEGWQLNWVDAIGLIAGAVMLWGMFRKTMIPVRFSLVFGNVGFIMFGIFTPSYPTLITHMLLLPINAARLYQVWKLIKTIRDAEQSNLSLELLLPYMKASSLKAGQVLFRKDDKADCMIIIEQGTVLIEELGTTCGPNSVLGEVAAFTPDGRRTATAVAQSDCRIYSLDNDTLLQIYYQNPSFGLFLIRTIVHRLLENWQHAEDRARML